MKRCSAQSERMCRVYNTHTDVMDRGCGQFITHVGVMVRGCGQYMAHVQMSWAGGVVSVLSNTCMFQVREHCLYVMAVSHLTECGLLWWLMGDGSWEVADLHCLFFTSVYFPLLLDGLVVTAQSFI